MNLQHKYIKAYNGLNIKGTSSVYTHMYSNEDCEIHMYILVTMRGSIVYIPVLTYASVYLL